MEQNKEKVVEKNNFFSKDINRMIILMFFCMFLYNLGHPATPGLIELRSLKKSISGEFLALMSSAMFLSSPYLGALADNLGMKKIFLFMPLMYGTAQLIFGFVNSLPVMFLARIMAGFASGGTYAIAFGYVSQISTKEEKAKNIAKVSSATIIGGAVGQKIGGMVAGIDTRYPFGLQFLCGALVSLVIIFFMRELKVDNNEKLKEKKNLNPLSTFKYIGELDKSSKFFCLIIFLTGVGIYSYSSALNYFFKFNLKLSSNVIGTYVMFASLTAFFGTSFLLPKLVKKYSETTIYRTMLFVGILIMCIIFSTFRFGGLQIGIIVYVIMMLYNMSYEIVRSLGNTIIAKKYKSEQGKILGVASAVGALGNAIGSLLSGYILAINPFLPFIVNIIILFGVLILILVKKI